MSGAGSVTFREFWKQSLDLRERAAEGDLDAMRELANRHDPIYRDAFQQACIDVLGYDPYE